jgi:AcrR family transcriptional regulator
LLDAAESVVLRAGIGSLTLDAVAAEAKVSKGGLLYHFPSKDSLIEAMVVRTAANWQRDHTEAIESQGAGPGRVPRGFLNMCLATPEGWTENSRRSSVVLVAAMANNPELARPLREINEELASLIKKDGLPPGVGEAVVLAVKGLWFDWMFGLEEISEKRLVEIRGALLGFVRDQAGSVKQVARGQHAGVKKAKRARLKTGLVRKPEMTTPSPTPSLREGASERNLKAKKVRGGARAS